MQKKYNVIYADPPWNLKAGRPIGKYQVENGQQVWVKAGDKSRNLAYPTMHVQEICALPVKTIAAADAHLYLWATNNTLPAAFRVIDAWGFKYSTTIVWAKNMMGGGLGGSYRINSEYLLFATRGRLKAQATAPTVHHVKREYQNGYPCHSKKPAYFRELIDRISPGERIELFARSQPAGWDVWGNEVPCSIEL